MKYKLYYFSSENGEREFVVISDRPQADVVAEFSGDAQLTETLDIDGDATALPCDRVLTKE
jgi:hypothetical protein